VFVSLSVRCLCHSIASKWLNLSSEFFQHLVTPSLQFSETNRRYEIATGSLLTAALRHSWVQKSEHLLSYLPCSTKVWSITRTMFCWSC